MAICAIFVKKFEIWYNIGMNKEELEEMVEYRKNN